MKFEDGWIKVSERMPPLGVDVLVYLGDIWIGYLAQSSGKFRDSYGYCEDGEVTHWRALPSPPETT